MPSFSPPQNDFVVQFWRSREVSEGQLTELPNSNTEQVLTDTPIFKSKLQGKFHPEVEAFSFSFPLYLAQSDHTCMLPHPFFPYLSRKDVERHCRPDGPPLMTARTHISCN
jgi:hypothetical protein